MAVNLSKSERVHKINLRKESLDDIVSQKVSLTKMTSKVALIIDYSKSMTANFQSGAVQGFIEKIVPLALKFDNNGELDAWISTQGFERLKGVTMDNFYGYAEREILEKYEMGFTYYAPVLRDVHLKYVGKTPSDIPSFLIFLTDGDCIDKEATTYVLKDYIGKKLYVQFIGIGKENYDFLKNLAEKFPHTNFLAMEDLESIDEQYLYNHLIENYKEFVQNMHEFRCEEPSVPKKEKKKLFLGKGIIWWIELVVECLIIIWLMFLLK